MKVKLDRTTRLGIAVILSIVLVGIFMFLPERTTHPHALEYDPDSPAIGNPYGNPVIVVLFSDYHCGPCKGLSNALDELTKRDTHLLVIFKEFPVLGENSVLAARAALAVHFANDSKYFLYHQALMHAALGDFTPDGLAQTASDIGMDPETFRKALQNPKIDEQIERSHSIAASLGFSGVPTTVIGGKVLVGDSIDQIKEAIEEVRNPAQKPQ